MPIPKSPMNHDVQGRWKHQSVMTRVENCGTQPLKSSQGRSWILKERFAGNHWFDALKLVFLVTSLKSTQLFSLCDGCFPHPGGWSGCQYQQLGDWGWHGDHIIFTGNVCLEHMGLPEKYRGQNLVVYHHFPCDSHELDDVRRKTWIQDTLKTYHEFPFSDKPMFFSTNFEVWVSPVSALMYFSASCTFGDRL